MIGGMFLKSDILVQSCSIQASSYLGLLLNLCTRLNFLIYEMEIRQDLPDGVTVGIKGCPQDGASVCLLLPLPLCSRAV